MTPGLPPTQFGGHPAMQPSVVEVSPEAAGLVRREKLGAAIGFAVVGILLAIGSFFLSWITVDKYQVPRVGLGGGPDDRTERAGVGSAVQTIDDLFKDVADAPEPGAIAKLAFPILIIALTVVCGALAVVAAIGLRKASRTLVLQIVAAAAVLVSAGVAVVALVDLGIKSVDDSGSSATTVAPADPAQEIKFEGEVSVYIGAGVWLAALALLGIAAALGPRIRYDLPEATTGHPAAGWATVPPLTAHTQVVAIVLGAVGALVSLAGYGFLPWAEDVIFMDLTKAAWDSGFGTYLAEGYFGWFGWLILLGTVLIAILLPLGKKPSGVNPRVLRPILGSWAILALLTHLLLMFDLISAGGEFGIAAYAVAGALGLSALACILPLRQTVRISHVMPA